MLSTVVANYGQRGKRIGLKSSLRSGKKIGTGYQELVHLKQNGVMAKNTSILLGDYFDNFINQQIKSGKFSSASEVIRAALRMFEHEENKKTELIKELKKGEKSGFVKNFNRSEFLSNLHRKHSAK